MAKTRKNFIICIQSVLILGLLCLVAFLLIACGIVCLRNRR